MGSKVNISGRVSMVRGGVKGPDGGRPSHSPSANNAFNLSCEMCHQDINVVRLPAVEGSSELTKMIRNICHHMKLHLKLQNEAIIPGVLPGERVFLCADCEKKMKTVLNLQYQITKALNQIQATVLDSKLVQNETKYPGSNGRIRQLRAMILNRYQNKLRNVQEKRNNAAVLGFGNPQQTQVAGRSASVSVADPNAMELDNDEDDNDEIEILEPSIISSSSKAREASSAIGFPPALVERMNSSRDDDDDDKDERTQKENSKEKNSNEADNASKKDEEAENTNGAVDSSNEDEDEKEDHDILAIDPKEPKWIFDGVEVFKCTGSKPGFKYLQCSSCNFTLNIPARGTRSSQLIIQIKRHILSAHKNATEQDEGTAEKRSKSTHVKKTVASMECDICGLHYKGGTQNLLKHKIVHMNQVERHQALAAAAVSGKYNFYYKFLLAKIKSDGLSKGLEASSKKTGLSYDFSSSDEDTEEKQLACTFCGRTFKRKNYLKLHLQTHSKLMQPRERTTTPEKIPTFQAGSKDEFLYGMGLAQAVKNPEKDEGNGGDAANKSDGDVGASC